MEPTAPPPSKTVKRTAIGTCAALDAQAYVARDAMPVRNDT
eukprot:CAMPEP_0169317950 /NCGR_PEP_ID=MMETSP1017-20121227/7012_1 /TAXON_ID=342587 /ORGANISM="Karlodinium micrum, Strain CCMP2283" /LENGTH=40 /DNA_ID= /DNA_START= /DNA_END= /DNA_ORIENTATION=